MLENDATVELPLAAPSCVLRLAEVQRIIQCQDSRHAACCGSNMLVLTMWPVPVIAAKY